MSHPTLPRRWERRLSWRTSLAPEDLSLSIACTLQRLTDLQISLSEEPWRRSRQFTGDARFDLAKSTYCRPWHGARTLTVGPDSSIRGRSNRRSMQRRNGAGPRRRNVHARHRGGLYLAALKLDCHVVRDIRAVLPAGFGRSRGETDALYVRNRPPDNFVKAKQNWALATIAHQVPLFPNRPTISRPPRWMRTKSG